MPELSVNRKSIPIAIVPYMPVFCIARRLNLGQPQRVAPTTRGDVANPSFRRGVDNRRHNIRRMLECK